MNNYSNNIGVSVVLCCHNSAARLTKTLMHLQNQKVPDHTPWEVVLVDNASTDTTAETAHQLWRSSTLAPLRVVVEPQLGLSHARERGFASAQYEFVSFVDDDNWAADDWIAKVYEIMSAHPQVGACGGMSEAVYEVQPQPWISKFTSKIAVGEQYPDEGDISESRGWLWGAGLTVRKSAWQKLRTLGWQPLLTGRQGQRLTSGEDNELCYQLRLLGWRLYYSPRLRLQHFIPSRRLRWDYLLNLAGSNGNTMLITRAYARVLRRSTRAAPERVMRSWLADLRQGFRNTCRLGRQTGWRSLKTLPGDENALALAACWAEICGLIQMGPRGYQQLYRDLAERWTQAARLPKPSRERATGT
jgi:glycosyltransferase involved in cell wall biosynthesis